MTTDLGGGATVTGSTKSSKHVFYAQLAQLLTEGGFDRHIGALCKPFISDSTGPVWWSTQPSSYFRILFVGYLEGIESEQELCWHIEDSRSFREFVGFGAEVVAPDPGVMTQIRQRLMPLILSEAFDALMRIIDKTGLLEGRVPGLESSVLSSDPTIAAIVQRISLRDHQNYWKRLTKTPGALRSGRSSIPPAHRSAAERTARAASGESKELEPFAIWVEDLSLAQASFVELRGRGVSDFKSHFEQHENPAVDHVIRACIYGRGPASVRAFLSAAHAAAGRDLPQKLSAESAVACRAIATALADGKRQFSIEVPLQDAEGNPAIALVQLAVQPGFEETLGSVLVSFTDITRRKRQPTTPQPTDSHIEKALRLNQVGVWEWDIKSEVCQWSDAMFAIYGITREDFTGRYSDYLELTYPDDRDIQRESVRQSFADFVNASHGHQPSPDSSAAFKDFRVRRGDGQIRWVRGGAVEVVDDQGRPVKMQGVLWDITEAKQAELSLRESEERYRRMVENAAIAVVVTAFDGEVIYANDAALAFFGVARDDLQKLRSINFWQDPTQRIQAASILAEVGELHNLEARYLVGSERHPKSALMSASVIQFGGRNVILSWHQELTSPLSNAEQIRAIEQDAEERVRAAQRQTIEQFQLAQRQAAEQMQELRQQSEAQLSVLQQQADEQLRLAQLRADEAIEARSRELELMHHVMAASGREPAAMLTAACSELGQALAWPLAVAGILAEDRSELRLVAEYLSTPDRTCLGTRIALEEAGLLATFAEHLHPIWIEDAANDERVARFRDLLDIESATCLLIVPLAIDGALAGMMLLGAGKGSELGADAMSLVSNVGGQVGRSLVFSRKLESHHRLKLAFERIREIVALEVLTGKAG